MNKVQIMIVGNSQQDITAITTKAGIHENRQYTGITDAEEAITQFQQGFYEVVLLDGKLEETERRKISSLFRYQDEELILIQETDDLEGRIHTALRNKERRLKRSFTITDDALQYAGMNIHLS